MSFDPIPRPSMVLVAACARVAWEANRALVVALGLGDGVLHWPDLTVTTRQACIANVTRCFELGRWPENTDTGTDPYAGRREFLTSVVYATAKAHREATSA